MDEFYWIIHGVIVVSLSCLVIGIVGMALELCKWEDRLKERGLLDEE